MKSFDSREDSNLCCWYFIQFFFHKIRNLKVIIAAANDIKKGRVLFTNDSGSSLIACGGIGTNNAFLIRSGNPAV